MAGIQMDWNTGSDIRLTQKVPAGHNLLNLDACGSHGDDEDLIVTWKKKTKNKRIIQFLSVDTTQSLFCAKDAYGFIGAWTTGWALWWWFEAFQLSLYLHSE